jgi:thiamine kinase-like enzyme
MGSQIMKGSITESTGYPSSDTRLSEEVFAKLTDLPDKGKISVEWFQEHVWKETQSFDIPKDEVICCMHSNIYKIVLKNEKNKEVNLVAKRVVPSELPAKASLKLWEDFLESVKMEIQFYQQEQKQLETLQLFPKIYYSNSGCQADKVMDSFHLLVMEDVSDIYQQSPSMSKTQACDLMKALAKFHAMYWNKIDHTAERGSFWVLSRRQPLGETEIANAESTWKNLLDRFPEFKDLCPDVESLGGALAAKAKSLDDYVAANLMTQIHGDCKGFNLFFKKPNIIKEDEQQVLLIDMQWTGIGHPLQDVAYALTTTLEADLLDSMNDFVDTYIECLSKEVEGLDAGQLRKDFDLIWLDYARVIITGLWKRLSPESIIKYQNVVGPSMIGRSLDHAKFIIKKIHHLLYVDNII